MTDTAKTYEFRTEVQKMLHIITHSLYTNREIFLRELLSNATDALEKMRFFQSRGDTVLDAELPLEIKITMDPAEKTLTIADSGVGMTHGELVDNLGTIARSGTERFAADLEAAAKDKEKGNDAASVIGRFGVGFYSVFMIADKVEVTSRPWTGEPAFVWTSDGMGEFSVSPAPELEEGEYLRGTRIKAYLKEDALGFLEKARLEDIIHTHSAFLPFPIILDDERINTTTALWREPKFSITKEQYTEFYKFLTADSEEPLDTLHLAVDAPVQFNALLFIPGTASDVYSIERDQWGLDLYVRRVLIQRENRDLLPRYLSFFKGVVDTEDLPLNISRETLQENVLLRKIEQTLVKQALGHLEKMAVNVDEYNKFWRLHGRIFKLGHSDFINRDKIAALLRFNTSWHEDAEGLCSFDDYISRAREGQKVIWFLSANSREAARSNPQLEMFRRKGIEVLYLYEPVDEFVLQGLGLYKEFSFRPIEMATRDSLESFSEVEQAETLPPLDESDNSSFDDLLIKMKETLGDAVVEVRISHRLTDSPACLVSPDGTMTSSMEKLMRVMQGDESLPPRVLEINREHRLLRSMLDIYKADPTDPNIKNTTFLLYDTTLLLDGYLKNPADMVARVNTVLEQSNAWYAESKKK